MVAFIKPHLLMANLAPITNYKRNDYILARKECFTCVGERSVIKQAGTTLMYLFTVSPEDVPNKSISEMLISEATSGVKSTFKTTIMFSS